MRKKITFVSLLSLGFFLAICLFLALNLTSIPPARAQTNLPSSVVTETLTMTVDYGWKIFSTGEVTRTFVTSNSVMSATSITTSMSAFPPKPGKVEIYSGHEIPIDGDGNFRMGPSTGFTTPFTLTQAFGNPGIPGTTQIYGTIAPGWCEYAEFVGATAGYNTGSYPTQACSWIEWKSPGPIPDVITVSVRYKGCWSMSVWSMVAWRVRYPGAPVVGQTYCLVGEPIGSNCPGGLLFEPQPCPPVYLPVILKNR